MIRSAIGRFWDKVRTSDTGCWIWVGANCGKRPYGQFWDGSHLVLAHRFAYEYYVGAVPIGLDLDHLCRNCACVNPSHLQPVSRSINNLRGDVGFNPNSHKTQSTCRKGHSEWYIRPNGTKLCLVCKREYEKERYYQKRLLRRPRLFGGELCHKSKLVRMNIPS